MADPGAFHTIKSACEEPLPWSWRASWNSTRREFFALHGACFLAVSVQPNAASVTDHHGNAAA
jgi:hypothetical protein